MCQCPDIQYNSILLQTVNHAPTKMLATTLARPMSTELVKPKECAPMAAFDVAELRAAVAIVYWEPANDVTFPPAPVARVIAWPPLEVITVASDPPMEVTVENTLPASLVATLKAEPAADVATDTTEPASEVNEFIMLPRFWRSTLAALTVANRAMNATKR